MLNVHYSKIYTEKKNESSYSLSKLIIIFLIYKLKLKFVGNEICHIIATIETRMQC